MIVLSPTLIPVIVLPSTLRRGVFLLVSQLVAARGARARVRQVPALQNAPRPVTPSGVVASISYNLIQAHMPRMGMRYCGVHQGDTRITATSA